MIVEVARWPHGGSARSDVEDCFEHRHNPSGLGINPAPDPIALATLVSPMVLSSITTVALHLQ